MKKYMLILLLLPFLIVGLNHQAQSQVIEPAPPDKAVVYFVRTVKGGFGLLKSTVVFDEDSPLGYLTYRTFMRYECDPGHHLLWIMVDGLSPNTFTYYKQYIEGDLSAGKIYLVEVRLQVEGIRMEPVNPFSDADKMDRIRQVLNSRGSIKANKILEKREYRRNKIHKSWVEKGLDKYSKFDEKDKVSEILSDWNVDPEDLRPADEKSIQ